jgi:hypothetical protein
MDRSGISFIVQEIKVNERKRDIREYLQQSEVQARLWKDIQEARSKATVTISRAANLFNFSESQLREWEKRGLLRTERPLVSQDGKGSTGHRQYSPAELDKLAIIHELLKHGYMPGDIPADVDKIWAEIRHETLVTRPDQISTPSEPATWTPQKPQRPIDKRLKDMDKQEFWRYFVSQALRISLLLLCQDIPDAGVGLILPLEDRRLAQAIDSPADLHDVGLSLVGWLGRVRSFYAFLEEPTFEFPSDFRLETLKISQGSGSQPDRVLDNVFIVVQRRSRSLQPSSELIETIRCILNHVYTQLDKWRDCFEYGRQDWLYQSHDLESISSAEGDLIFNSLLEQMIELGGKSEDGQDRWDFCALLLPNDIDLPIQQQNLRVRAQTIRSPYEIGITTVDPALTDSLSLKAFQSGQIIYFSETLPGETMVTYQLPPIISREAIPSTSNSPILEKYTQSAFALPVVRESGLSTAVLYIAAREVQAFSKEDLRVLRVLGRMVAELLRTSHTRRQVAGDMGSLISNPSLVDVTFQGFGSETDFISEIEGLLRSMCKDELADKVLQDSLSIISVDMDSQSSIALKYRNRVARSISQEMGLRIKRQIQLSDSYASSKLFHISADRYYLLLRRLSLEETRSLAVQLKAALQGDYRIKSPYATTNHPAFQGNILEISSVTVHLGVSHYPFEKFVELLSRSYLVGSTVSNVRGRILAGIEGALGMGGDRIITWDPVIWSYRPLD